MNYSFVQKYTFPVTVASAVALYLDCEHYIFLHHSIENKYKILDMYENKYISEMHYQSGIFKWKQISTTEYIAPAELKQYDVKIKGFGFAILANLFNVKTTLKYYENKKDCEVLDIEKNKNIRLDKNNKIVISEINYDIDMPFFIYPFKNVIKRRLEKMKLKKELEDLYFIQRRINLFGSDEPLVDSKYWAPFMKKSYFMLYKEKFIQTFFKNI